MKRVMALLYCKYIYIAAKWWYAAMFSESSLYTQHGRTGRLIPILLLECYELITSSIDSEPTRRSTREKATASGRLTTALARPRAPQKPNHASPRENVSVALAHMHATPVSPV